MPPLDPTPTTPEQRAALTEAVRQMEATILPWFHNLAQRQALLEAIAPATAFACGETFAVVTELWKRLRVDLTGFPVQIHPSKVPPLP